MKLSIRILNICLLAFFSFFAFLGLYICLKQTTDADYRWEYFYSVIPYWIYLIILLSGIIATWKSVLKWSWVIYLCGAMIAILFGLLYKSVHFYYLFPFILITLLIRLHPVKEDSREGSTPRD